MNATAEYHLSLFQRGDKQRPFVLGHRGLRAPDPRTQVPAENTIEAYARALSAGADGVEVDIRMSHDGALIVAHDDKVALHSSYRQLSAAQAQPHEFVQLSKLSIAQIHQLPRPCDEKIPTLRDILKFQAETGARLNIELKGDVPAPLWMTQAVIEQVRAHGGAHILFSSFSPFIVLTLSRRLPEVPVVLLFDETQHIMKRLLPLKLLGAQGAHPQSSILDKTLVRRIRKKAPLIGTWTPNDAIEARRLARLGVDTLITDDPARVRSAVDEDFTPRSFPAL